LFIDEILELIVQRPEVSDLHLTANMKPIIRVNGELEPLDGEWEKLTVQDVKDISRHLMNDQQYQTFQEEMEIDFSHSLGGIGRFRVNAYHQRSSVALALRIIPPAVKTLEELNMPPVLKNLSRMRSGLVLCTGPTGSGKSTTQAAIVDQINSERTCHVMTLEDPIEYLHRNKRAIVHQREIGGDSRSFSRGLRSALRQDPDVIQVGEMRDLETISIAMEAAETGHLVMATLHTNDAPQAVDRIIDVYPPHQQNQIRFQLASVLKAVLAHDLLPTKDRQGRVLAMEILLGNSAVKNLIREGKTFQLYSVMQTSSEQHMQTMDSALGRLYEKGQIEFQVALERCSNPELIKRYRGA